MKIDGEYPSDENRGKNVTMVYIVCRLNINSCNNLRTEKLVVIKLKSRNQIKLALNAEDYSLAWTTERLTSDATHEPSLSLTINS